MNLSNAVSVKRRRLRNLLRLPIFPSTAYTPTKKDLRASSPGAPNLFKWRTGVTPLLRKAAGIAHLLKVVGMPPLPLALPPLPLALLALPGRMTGLPRRLETRRATHNLGSIRLRRALVNCCKPSPTSIRNATSTLKLRTCLPPIFH